ASSLGTLPLVLPSRPNGIRAQVDGFLTEHGLKVQRVALAETPSLCLELARQRLGYTVLPYCAIYRDPQRDEIAHAPIRGRSMTWTLQVNRERKAVPAVARPASVLERCVRARARTAGWRHAEAIPVPR